MRRTKSLDNLLDMSSRGKTVLNTALEQMLAPDTLKTAPLFTLQAISTITGVHRSTISKAIQKELRDRDGFPLSKGRVLTSKGDLVPYEHTKEDDPKNRRYFSCDEAAQLITQFAPHLVKPKGGKGGIIAVCNYKGGVSKTVTTVCLAQALASRGKKVLVLDIDPQGSATNLFGFLHFKDVLPEDTALGVFQQKTSSLRNCIRTTYWPNIDLIPASSALQGSEFAYRQLLSNEGYDSVGILGAALHELMSYYDVCLIDTPPSLNSLTNSALFAADGVVMPIPASNLEVASAVQFWDMYCNICLAMPDVDIKTEVFSFVKVVLPKMENTISCRNVRKWLYEIYGEDISPNEIPKSTAVSRASDSFGTVFDVIPGQNKKLLDAMLPVKTAYENIALELEEELQHIWAKTAPVSA